MSAERTHVGETKRGVLARLAVAARRALDHRATATVCYFPSFPDAATLADHYHRAAWYLPRVRGRCERVVFWQDFAAAPPDALPCPEAMAESPPPAHFEVRRAARPPWSDLRRARLVLVWRAGRWGRLLRLARRCGLPVVHVETDDPASLEYVNYAFALWRDLLRDDDREAVLARSKARFAAAAAPLRSAPPPTARVLGTGPSLAAAAEIDFRGTLCIACNSIVRDTALLQHVAPRFLCAADVVSHFGVSRYAARFRSDLAQALAAGGVDFVTEAAIGHLWLTHRPELEERVILVEQRGREPNFDLLDDFRLPLLDSVLNACMLPLAATFTRVVEILGCDGRSPGGGNEDFWAHAESAQYRDLVATGHRCHPTFAANRAAATYGAYLDSVEVTLRSGEERHGITYRALRPSAVPALAARYAAARPGTVSS